MVESIVQMISVLGCYACVAIAAGKYGVKAGSFVVLALIFSAVNMTIIQTREDRKAAAEIDACDECNEGGEPYGGKEQER